MKSILWIIGVPVVLIAAFLIVNSFIYNEKQGDMSNREIPVQVIPISHATAVLVFADTVIRAGRQALSFHDLENGILIAVIGTPDTEGQIHARLIRILPQKRF